MCFKYDVSDHCVCSAAKGGEGGEEEDEEESGGGDGDTGATKNNDSTCLQPAGTEALHSGTNMLLVQY